MASQINDSDMEGSAPPNQIQGGAPSGSAQSQPPQGQKARAQDGTIFSKSNMGTRNTNAVTPPTAKPASNVDELHAEYKQYKLLRKKDEMNTKSEPGVAAYVVASSWIAKYETFIMFDQFDQNIGTAPPDVHFTEKHPGPIMNIEELGENDADGANLYGTGTVKGLEREYLDQYVDPEKKFQQDYYIFNEELWKFFFERYGGQGIQRFYIRKENRQYPTVEATLKQVRIKFLDSGALLSGQYSENMLREWWTQVSQQATLKEVKARILDSLTSSGYKLTAPELRLWIDFQSADVEQNLAARCGQVSSSSPSAVDDQEMNPDQAEAQGPDQVQIELNSGVEFPGQSLEPLLNSGLRLKDIRCLSEKSLIVVEFKEKAEDSFAFKFRKGEKVSIGICEWCSTRNILKTVCKCKNVKYCNEDCMEKDKRFHVDKCSAQADGELQTDIDDDYTENSKKGLVGLSNLGNTCYMNSSIQCLSNTYELTQFFLQKKYKSMMNRKTINPLGTEGRIVQAWAKLISEMWKGEGQVVRPDLFKRILGQYNVTFEGYGQHDSQECINTVLDFMSEDLYKQDKKPYVEQTETEGKSDEVASAEAWNNHVFRNESVIVDMFYGQFKSTLTCALCSRISITFDPFLMASIPIPSTKYVPLQGYYIQYHLNKDGQGLYKNYKLELKAKDNERVADLRERVHEKYGIQPSSYLIGWVTDNKMQNFINSQMSISEVNAGRAGVMLFFEIPKELQPTLPPVDQIDKYDSNHGIDADWVKVVLHVFKEGRGLLNLPRVMWINKKWSLQEVHMHVFHYFKDLMLRWYKEVKDTGKSNKSSRLPEYKDPDTGEILTYDSLLEMTENAPQSKLFRAFFPVMFTEEFQKGPVKKSYSQAEMPYFLRVENTSSYRQNCHFCENSSCQQSCPLPFDEKQTVLDMLHKVGVEDNLSFYHGERGKSDLILNLVWQGDFEGNLQRHLSSVQGEAERVETYDVSKEAKKIDVAIDDCFEEFKKPEILDQDNMWYCNKCKAHVQATKQIEIYKVPPIFVVSLKRFKQDRQQKQGYMSMFSGGGGGQKIDEQVDFPLEGLDMRKYMSSSVQTEESMVYDCYAVSNHYGNMGFGHYTAFAVNPMNGQWYEYDDSNVRQISKANLEQTVVTNAAYNLFYRRRDWHQKNIDQGVDFDQVAVRPDLSMFDKQKK